MRKKIVLIGAVACIVLGLAGIAGCAPQESGGQAAQGAEQQGSSAGSVTVAAWSPDIDCAQCHSGEATSMQSTSCLAKAHSDEGYTCTDCHADAATLKSVHESSDGATPASKLKKTKVDRETCLSCHGSLEEIAAKTADVAVTDDKGTAVNPHALTSNQDHDALACTSCHISHEETDTATEAKSTCMSCHHAGVFECGTCHE